MAVRVNVADEATYRIRRLIVERRLAPGDKLPSERELTQILGVSRTSVRAALQELQAIGLLEISAARGAFLSRDGSNGVVESIRSWFELKRLRLPELIEFRAAVEPAAAAAAARRRDDADLAYLQTQLDVMAECTRRNDPAGFAVADMAFHQRIASASRNRLFLVMAGSLAEVLRVYREVTARLGVPLLARSLADHQKIADAVRLQDADAAHAAALSHIVETAVDFRIVARDELP